MARFVVIRLGCSEKIGLQVWREQSGHGPHELGMTQVMLAYARIAGEIFIFFGTALHGQPNQRAVGHKQGQPKIHQVADYVRIFRTT